MGHGLTSTLRRENTPPLLEKKKKLTSFYSLPVFLTQRGSEIIPPWAPWATDDHWTLWWMDSGLQGSHCFLIKSILLNYAIRHHGKQKIVQSLYKGGLNCRNEKWWHLLRNGATVKHNDFFFNFPSIQDMDKRLQALMAACEKLPTDNLNNFRSVAFPDFLSLHLYMIPSGPTTVKRKKSSKILFTRLSKSAWCLSLWKPW